MYYYVFKAISKDGKIEKEYLYNEAIHEKFSKDVMMTLVKEFIKKDFKKQGLNMKDFNFTRKLLPYKNFRSRYENMKFINNRTIPDPEPVPEEMKQSEEKKEANQTRMKEARKKYLAKAKLHESPYGKSIAPNDPNFKH